MPLGSTIGRLAAELALDSSDFVTGSTSAQKALANLAGKFTNIGQSVTNAGKTMTKGITLPLAGVGATVIKFAADFEDGMKGLSIATEATASEMAKMKDIALDIGNATTFGAAEAASAMEMLAKAGIDTELIINGAAKAVTNLAAAAGSELDPAASAISDSITQFHLSAKDLPTIVNQITGAVNESKFGFDDFTYGMAQAGGVASSAGVSFKDFAATLAATSSQFSSGADAGTSFKTFLLGLTPQTKKAAAIFKEYGLNFFQANGQMKSMAEVADILREKFSGLSDEARNSTLQELFGTDAIRTAVGLMNQGADGIERISQKLADTSAADQAAKQMGGLSGQIEQLKGAFETLAIAIADTGLLTAFTAIVKRVADFVSWLSEASPTTMKVVVGAIALTAALGPLTIALGAIATSILPFFLIRMGGLATAFSFLINPIGTVLGLLSRFAAAAVATGALNAAFAGLGAVLAPIAVPLLAIAAAGALIYANWDKISPVLQSAWENLKQVLGPPVQELIATVSELFSELWSGPLGSGLRSAIGALEQVRAAFASALGTALIEILKLVIAAVIEVAKAVADMVRIVNAVLKGDWRAAINAGVSLASKAFGGLPVLIIGYMRQMVTGIKSWVVDRLSAIWTSVTDKIETVRKAFFNLYDAVVGHSYVPDMVDGIAAQMQRLDAEFVNPADKAAQKVGDKFEALRDRIAALTAELFPEIGQRDKFRSDMDTIDTAEARGTYTPEQAAEARNRLLQRSGALDGVNEITKTAYPELVGAANDNASALEAANVRVAKSFKDMATDTLNSIQGLANSIKGGGFLDILGSVIGLATQLGSIGAFGKGVQANLNKSVPGYAVGTSSAARGLALVGERGPELVAFGGGERVFTNSQSRGMMGGGRTTNVFQGNLMTPEFWAMIQAGDVQAAGMGSTGAQVALARKQSRAIP